MLHATLVSPSCLETDWICGATSHRPQSTRPKINVKTHAKVRPRPLPVSYNRELRGEVAFLWFNTQLQDVTQRIQAACWIGCTIKSDTYKWQANLSHDVWMTNTHAWYIIIYKLQHHPLVTWAWSYTHTQTHTDKCKTESSITHW